MAFSFRAGTNWCHDFPKLARESGFYFNMHTARVRVDWNRISTIDIDRLIRERDFQTIDENVNYVIDYYLESEYDVKILDPNFVKLFRLAQLAVEYLLYCKQYLDQSVVILKEELKYKLEENVKLKEEIRNLQIIMKEMREKSKEKKNSSEVKVETIGEIHKCPHCPKTFVSASFANAHLIRRHSNIDVLSSSPVREEYKAETEKLHNEIKNLKERLNQTERVIRSESSKIMSQQETEIRDKPMTGQEAGNSTLDDQYRKYQEEISNLKSMLFTEIRNIKSKESINSTQQENEIINENIKEVLNQQENEIERLKSQLQENLSINANEVQSQLGKQEEYWKLKIDQLEGQHRNDIENLFAQLKLTQESAMRMKSDYEDKVNFLEKQSIDQSKLLAAQAEQLNNITKGMLDHQSKNLAERESNLSRKLIKQPNENFNDDTLDSESSHKPKKSKVPKQNKHFLSDLKSKPSYNKFMLSKKTDESKVVRHLTPPSKSVDNSIEKSASHRIMNKPGNRYSSLNESEESETLTETDTVSEGDSETESTESEGSRTESTNDEISLKEEKLPKIRKHKRTSSESKNLKEEILENFERKLRELGIDPEWNGVPVITFKQKMESVKHHQNIAAKTLPKYEQVRRKILEDLAKKIITNQKASKETDSEKKSFFNKSIKNVKSKAMRALNEFKIQKGNETSTSVSSKNSSPKDSESRRKFNFELLPKKPTHQDIQEIKKQTKFESVKKEKPKKEELSKGSLFKEKPIPPQTTEVIIEPSKRLQRSYNTIEDFMKDIDNTSKLDMESSKVTSTPSRKTNNLLQETYNTVASDSEGQIMKQDTLYALVSPKNNKGVLKLTSNVSGGSVKKKVLFDLEKETSIEKSLAKISSELPDLFSVQKESNDSDWNTSSISEEKEELTVLREKSASNENIHLKTSQSEKIAEISRKIQEKLDASRRKPAGSIEAMFSAKNFSVNEDVEVLDRQNSIDRLSTIMESLSSQTDSKSKSSDQLPRPAPRRQQ